MYRLLLPFVVIVTQLNPVVSLAASKPLTIRVLCYNIHYGQGNDGKYDLQRLAEVIRAAKPDLVALQEVDVGVERSGRQHQLRILGELTGLAVRFGPTQHYQGGLFGNAIMTSLPIKDVHIQPLPYTDSTPDRTTYPRGAISVDVELSNGQPLRFISTHFQHNVPDDRVAEAKAVNRFFGSSEVPTILAGDMNATPDAEPVRILENVWQNAIDRENSPTAPSSRPRARIDYIFYRGGEISPTDSRVVAEPMASDHCPVLAVFEIAGRPGND